MDEAQRRKAVISEKRTDIERWGAPESLDPAWDSRAQVAAERIPSGACVFDLGCGAMALERYLPPACTYVPCDVVARDPRTRLCDFNHGRLPEGISQADRIVLLGVLEYVYDLRAFLAEVAKTGKITIASYCPADLGAGKDRAALGWVNALTREGLRTLFRDAGFSVRNEECFDGFQVLFVLECQAPQPAPKNVVVLSYGNVGNFGDRLGYHQIASVMPAHASVRHVYHKPWSLVEGDIDLLVVGAGNSLYGPLITEDLLALIRRARKSIGIFGTQYRSSFTPEQMKSVTGALDCWFARYEEDLLRYASPGTEAFHLGDWLIGACAMAKGTDDQVLTIGDEIWQDWPLDRVIQSIQSYRAVFSSRLHPLLCALTSAERVAYLEQRDGSGEVSGKFRSLLIDVFGRNYPENAWWDVDRGAVMAYKARVADGIERLRHKVAELLASGEGAAQNRPAFPPAPDTGQEADFGHEQSLQRAVESHRLGRIADAERMYQGILAMSPHHFDALHMLGVVNLQQGRYQKAEELIGRALKVRQTPNAYYNYGAVLGNLKRLNDALASYERALQLKPDYVEALNNRGNILRELGRPDEALASYDRAIQLAPAFAEALNNRGNSLRDMGRREEALASYRRAFEAKPDYAEAYYNFANELRESGRHAEAVANYDRALEIKPDYVEALNNRGLALENLNRVENALASYERAIEVKPDWAEAHNDRGNALRHLQRLDESLDSFDRAIQLKPDYAEAYNNRAVALTESGRPEEALVDYDRALALKPDYGDAHYNRGNALRDLMRMEDALSAYASAIALRPDYVSAHWNESAVRLLLGDFEAGWRKYEWRFRLGELGLAQRAFEQPRWSGSEDLRDRTLLLHCEQGLGDAIHFCRYASLIKARGARRVVLEVPSALKPLLSHSLAGVDVIANGDALPPFDYHCSLFSLPLALGTTPETIPAAPSYLSAPADKVDSWKARLDDVPGPRIGLVWSGNPNHKNDRNRSIPLKLIEERLAGDFVCLQKDIRDGERPLLERMERIRFLGNELRDFSDTAALIANTDLVVSVDTSVAHLAAALGKPVWILVTFVPDWRWMLERGDSPWYPTARLFRQSKNRDWDEVLDRVARELTAFRESWRPQAAGR